MPDPDRLRPISLILSLLGFAVGVGLIIFFLRPSDPPVVLWGDLGNEKRYREIHDSLDLIVIPEVNWSDIPFGDALDQLISWVHVSNPSAEEIRIKIDERVPKETPISLKLKNVPASEVFRYLSVLNQAKYQIHGEGRIDIVPISVPDTPQEGWFSVDPVFFNGIDPTKPEEIRAMFALMGIEVAPSETIEFFPNRKLLKVYSSPDNLDLIDSYISSMCVIRHGWRDRLNEWWHQTKIKLSLAPAPLPATPSPQSPLHRIPSVLRARVRLALHQIPSGTDHRPQPDTFVTTPDVKFRTS